jgi:nucleoside-diphosphate-sugar epimerase
MPVHTANIIAAARMSGATVMIVGNVYVFGRNAPEIYTEDIPCAPTTRKGAIRVTMEHTFEAAATARGVRSIILRGGDFIEREKTGNWFDSYMTNKLHKGEFTYPGRRDAVHAWAYLPDMARAMVGLAEVRDRLPAFASFGFEGYSLTGDALHKAVELAVGRSLKIARFPWPLLLVAGVFSPLMREVLEMRYLWDRPHRLDGGALGVVLPDFVPTPLEVALRDVLLELPHTAPREAAQALRSA